MVTRSAKNGACRCVPSSIMPGCQLICSVASSTARESSGIGSAKLAKPRLKGPAPIAATSTCSESRLIINPREFGYQFMPGVTDQVDDLHELLQRRVRIQQRQFEQPAVGHGGGGNHGLTSLVKPLTNGVGTGIRTSNRQSLTGFETHDHRAQLHWCCQPQI